MTTTVEVELSPAGILSWQFGTGAAVGGSGPADASVLDTDDGDASYFDWQDVHELEIGYGAYPIPAAAQVETVVQRLMLKNVGAFDVEMNASVYMNADDVGPHGPLGFADFTVTANGAWHVIDQVLTGAGLTNALATDLSAPATVADLVACVRRGALAVTVVEIDVGAQLRIGYAPIFLDYPSTVRPPLRQFPRDDALGGQPRQGHRSRSVQSSARQSWAGTYR